MFDLAFRVLVFDMGEQAPTARLSGLAWDWFRQPELVKRWWETKWTKSILKVADDSIHVLMRTERQTSRVRVYVYTSIIYTLYIADSVHPTSI